MGGKCSIGDFEKLRSTNTIVERKKAEKSLILQPVINISAVFKNKITHFLAKSERYMVYQHLIDLVAVQKLSPWPA